MNNFNIMPSWNQIALFPASVSHIESRALVNPYDKDGKLPIFISPMTCILDKHNFSAFNDSKFIPIMPVWSDTKDGIIKNSNWQAMTLDTFEHYFVKCNAPLLENGSYHICMDCAQGHMYRIFLLAEIAKYNYPDIVLMAGNIANPEAYEMYCDSKIDYVRVGIGGGSGCTTSLVTGMHVPLPYLISEIATIKENLKKISPNRFFTKIVADGGIDTPDKILKALALGADYVMIGKMAAKCEEACGSLTGSLYLSDHRLYYGQASKQGQIDRFGKVKSNPEGTEVQIEIEYTLSQLEEALTKDITSSMSYANATTLNEFHPKWGIQSVDEFNSYNKNYQL